jgi:hypothetical protein
MAAWHIGGIVGAFAGAGAEYAYYCTGPFDTKAAGADSCSTLMVDPHSALWGGVGAFIGACAFQLYEIYESNQPK